MEKSVKNKKKRGKKLVSQVDGNSKYNNEGSVKYKKIMPKLDSNSIDESLELSKIDSSKSKSRKKSKKLKGSPGRNETEISSNMEPDNVIKYQKVNTHDDVDSFDKSIEEGSENEMDVDSSSSDESNLSDGESVHSESSFNIDSYPSDDEDEEEVENKKQGLPLGAVPSTELEERENRTIFVGNLPKTVERHELRKWFSRFGKVECVRLRSAPIADLEMPKKVAVIKKSFHENRSNIHAYIRYKDMEGAQNALLANCSKFGEHTLRVDHARHKGGYDGKRAVFVGNVPFNIEENSLITLFSKCGEIDGVRIIRDKETGVGKGFAYVNFKCSSSVPLALKLDGEVLEKRQLRVKPIKYNGKNPYKIPQKRNNFKLKSKFRNGETNKGLGEVKGNGPSRKHPLKKNKFQGELSKRKERKKYKKKSSIAKKHEIYSKILANKKKTV